MRDPLKLGFFIQPVHPPARRYADVLREDREAVVLADRLGYGVADQILAFCSEVGEFGTLLYTGHDWVEPALARRSMELMAREVIPRVNKALGLTPESRAPRGPRRAAEP